MGKFLEALMYITNRSIATTENLVKYDMLHETSGCDSNKRVVLQINQQ